MKPLTFLLLLHLLVCRSLAQNIPQISKDSILSNFSVGACSCIDSIDVRGKSTSQVMEAVKKCIDNVVLPYQVVVKFTSIDILKGTVKEKNGKKNKHIAINTNENAEEYKSYYYEMETYLMNHCAALKSKISNQNLEHEFSYSKNPEAIDYYNKGIEASKAENTKDALGFFKQALIADSVFAFAWDNLGLCYRKLGEYDKALAAYQKSVSIDPAGTMPLQNIAIVYGYKKEYLMAIEAYKKLAVLDEKNPETYYGIGQSYALGLKDYENGLNYMCMAYNLYVEQKSAYRSDAVKVIQMIFAEMKKLGKEETFNKILSEHHISTK